MPEAMPTPGPQTPDQPEIDHGGHGTSPAAWAATIGVIVGTFITSVAMIFASVTFIVVGAVVIVLGALAWPVLARAGFGERSHDREVTGGPRSVS